MININEFSFTVPADKEILNRKIRTFVSSNFRHFDYNETKDGFIYSIDFNSDLEREEFKRELNLRFPNLYM